MSRARTRARRRQTIGHGALACPSCDVPIVASDADPHRIGRPLPVLPAAPHRAQLSEAGPQRHAAQRCARDRSARALSHDAASITRSPPGRTASLVAWRGGRVRRDHPRRGRTPGRRVRGYAQTLGRGGHHPRLSRPLDACRRRARAHRRAPARAGPLPRGDQAGGRGRPARVRIRRGAVSRARGSLRPRAGGEGDRARGGADRASVEVDGLPVLDARPPRTRTTSRRCGTWRRCWRPAFRWSPSCRSCTSTGSRCARSPTPKRGCSASTCTSR